VNLKKYTDQLISLFIPELWILCDIFNWLRTDCCC